MVSEKPNFPSPLHVLLQPLEGRAVFQAIDLFLVHIDRHVLHEKLWVRDASSHDEPFHRSLVVILAPGLAFFTSAKRTALLSQQC